MRPPMPKVVMLIRRLPSEFLVGAPDQLAKISAARLGARPIQLTQGSDLQTQAHIWTTEYGTFQSVSIVANRKHGIVV